MVALPEQRLGLVLGCLHLSGAPRLHHDHVHGIGIGLFNANDLSLGRGNGEQNDIILILSVGGLPLRGQYPNDGEWNLLDTNCLADRVGLPEKIGYNGFSKQGDLRCADYILRAKRYSVRDSEVADY